MKNALQEKFIALFNDAPIKKATGMTIHYNTEGQAVFHFPRNSNLDHALHDVHGGLIATLLDNAGWFTVAAHYGCWVVTAEFQVRLLEEAKQEELISTGRILRAGSRLATADMEVRSASGRLVAVGSGTFSKTGKTVEI